MKSSDPKETAAEFDGIDREGRLVQQLRDIDEALVLEEESEASLREVLDTLQRSPKFSRIGPFAGLVIAGWILDGGLQRTRGEMGDALESLGDFEEKLQRIAHLEGRATDVNFEEDLQLRTRAVFDILGLGEIGRTILRVETMIASVCTVGSELDEQRRKVRAELETLLATQQPSDRA